MLQKNYNYSEIKNRQKLSDYGKLWTVLQAENKMLLITRIEWKQVAAFFVYLFNSSQKGTVLLLRVDENSASSIDST